MENVASYESCELNLDRLGSRIIVYGSTGAGKTTLFVDALTAAFFKKAYGESDASSAWWILRSGSDKPARIEVDFEVEGVKYRVQRIFHPDRRSQAWLYVLDDEGRVQRILASTVQTVDVEVEKLIKLDYRTFLYTLLIRQGEVAGIIGRSVSPSQRREVFMRAFGIDFEEQREEAKRLRDTYHVKAERLKADISRIKSYTSRLKDLENLLESIESELNSSLGEVSKLRAELNEIEEGIRRSEDIRSSLNRELGKLEVEYSKLKGSAEKLRELKSRREAFTRSWERYPVLKSEIEKLRSRIDFLEKLRGRIMEYEMLKSRISSLETSIGLSRSMKRRLEELKNSYDELYRRIKLLEKVEEEKITVMDSIERIQTEIVSLEEQLRFAIASYSELSKSDVCPVCESKLTEPVRESLQKRFMDEAEKLKRTIDDKKLILDVLRERIRECEARITALSQARGALKPIEEEMEKIRFELSRIPVSEEDYTKARQSLLSIESELRSILGFVYSGLDEFDRRLEEIRSVYRSLDEEVKKLEYSQMIVNDMDGEIARLEYETMGIGKIGEAIDDVRRRLTDVDSSLKDMLRRRSEVNSKLELYIKRCEELKTRKKDVEEKIHECMKYSEELSRLEAELKDALHKYNVYRILYEKVFHDKGFPMYLLHEIISSVEYWSRVYLSKLLPRVDLKMDISRDGDISIKVYSDGFERELSTYSGGEATLIGFAIRLGIAKTLAERRGVEGFKMLILDEGFGPLSDEFRSLLLDVLKEFCVDYEKIIVISHIEDIQNSPVFTNAIYVGKDPSGRSYITITSSGSRSI
ncbi:MAG: SMC family ATPase [Nitrososphaerota archaeon]|nr:SMC family ATPase [Nitrososphaerota archaeon]